MLPSKVDDLGDYFKHPVICLDPTLLAAPNTNGYTSVADIKQQYEKQKQQIISSYERQVQVCNHLYGNTFASLVLLSPRCRIVGGLGWY